MRWAVYSGGAIILLGVASVVHAVSLASEIGAPLAQLSAQAEAVATQLRAMNDPEFSTARAELRVAAVSRAAETLLRWSPSTEVNDEDVKKLHSFVSGEPAQAYELLDGVLGDLGRGARRNPMAAELSLVLGKLQLVSERESLAWTLRCAVRQAREGGENICFIRAEQSARELNIALPAGFIGRLRWVWARTKVLSDLRGLGNPNVVHSAAFWAELKRSAASLGWDVDRALAKIGACRKAAPQAMCPIDEADIETTVQASERRSRELWDRIKNLRPW